MLAENLKKVRQELGLSVAKFADKLEMSASTLTGYERSERTPSLQLFTQLYKKLNVNLNWLVSGEGEMFNANAKQFEQEHEVFTQIVHDLINKELEARGL